VDDPLRKDFGAPQTGGRLVSERPGCRRRRLHGGRLGRWEPRLNCSIIRSSEAACSFIDSVAAAASSTSEAFCCTTLSICVAAVFTWPIPALCSWLAAAISATRSLTLRTEATISSIVLPAASTSFVPAWLVLRSQDTGAPTACSG
jgi:hypothetical protein